jgi:NAD(P)-dependent dehydrogenase (short-subunit alcohol dehydrogenase family)
MIGLPIIEGRVQSGAFLHMPDASKSEPGADQVPGKRLRGQVAIVTGAAHGIGRATAVRLSQEGASVVLVDLLGDVAKEVAQTLPNAIAVQADVTDSGQLEAMVAQARERFGEVSILVNNAGGAVFPPKPLWERTAEDWDFLIRLNLTSAWLATNAVLPSMRASGAGAIVNVSSAAKDGRRGLGPYGAAKAGIVSLTRTFALELGAAGIRVNAVVPGFIRFTRPKTVLTAEEVAMYEKQAVASQALHRLGQPEDIAAAVAFLVSPDAAQITGQTLTIDGGGD